MTDSSNMDHVPGPREHLMVPSSGGSAPPAFRAGAEPVPDFLGPGMSGPEVTRIQELLKVPATGIYDDRTELAVRGQQVLHKHPMRDGVWDAELESAIVSVSRLNPVSEPVYGEAVPPTA